MGCIKANSIYCYTNLILAVMRTAHIAAPIIITFYNFLHRTPILTHYNSLHDIRLDYMTTVNYWLF